MLVKWLVKRFTFTLQTVKWLFCGFDRFWKSKWTGENGHFSNSEWASASRFIYNLKIAGSWVKTRTKSLAFKELKKSAYGWATITSSTIGWFFNSLKESLNKLKNQHLVDFQIVNEARCWGSFTMRAKTARTSLWNQHWGGRGRRNRINFWFFDTF